MMAAEHSLEPTGQQMPLRETLMKLVPPLYAQRYQQDPTFFAKLVSPNGDRVWYVAEGSAAEDNDFQVYAYIDAAEPDSGYFLLSELESLGVISDSAFKPVPASKIFQTA